MLILAAVRKGGERGKSNRDRHAGCGSNPEGLQTREVVVEMERSRET